MAAVTDKTEELFEQEAKAFCDSSPLIGQPHWHIVIRPDTFKPDRIAALEDYCDKIRSYSKNNKFGGWPYPFIDAHFHARCKEAEQPAWIESFCRDDEKAPVQNWRFYKSGQFIHFLSFQKDDKSRRQLETDSLIQTTTQAFDFSGWLATALDAVLLVNIEMVSVKDFVFCDEAAKIPGKVCTFQTIPHPCIDPARVRPAAPGNELDRHARKTAASLLRCLEINIAEDVLQKRQAACRQFEPD